MKSRLARIRLADLPRIVRFRLSLVTTLISDVGLRRAAVAGVNSLADLWFDLRNGTSTVLAVPLDDLEIPSQNKAFGQVYQGAPSRPVVKLMESLDFPPGSVLVDFGAGKGRVLLAASRLPFSRVVGVEFSEELCAIARRNVTRFQERHRTCPVEVLNQDAVEYGFQDDENVVFFFNPFGKEVMEPVLEHLNASLARRPRPIWILYIAPYCGELVEAMGFPKTMQFVHGKTGVSVYARG